jgi:tellurite resistance protein
MVHQRNNKLTLFTDFMETPTRISLLEFLPVSMFGAVMGLCGLSFAWRLANNLWHLNLFLGEIIGGIAVALFLTLLVTFVVKYRRYPAVMRNEFNHPITVSFYATPIIGLLLIPGVILPYLPVLATIMWTLGVITMGTFAWYVLRRWIDHQQLPENAMPAWVIPILGTLDVPIAGTRIPIYGAHEICLIFFGIGLVFAVILLVIIISRLIFQEPLPASSQPTMLILTAAFALSFSGYQNITGIQDIFTTIIFYFNLFLFALLASKLLLLPGTCPFYVSWWSVSFPLSAVTITTFYYAQHKPGFVHQIIAAAFLTITTSVILFLAVQSLYRIWKGTFATSAPVLHVSQAT